MTAQKNIYLVRMSNPIIRTEVESNHYIVEAETKEEAGLAVKEMRKTQNPLPPPAVIYVMDLCGIKPKLTGNPNPSMF